MSQTGSLTEELPQQKLGARGVPDSSMGALQGNRTSPEQELFIGASTREEWQIAEKETRPEIDYHIEMPRASRMILLRPLDKVLVAATFIGGFGLLVVGVIFGIGFLSWMGTISLGAGFVHLITLS